MANYTYIKQSISKKFVEFGTALSPDEYNNIGTTWQDYLDNKWVLLTAAQAAFRNEHPNAGVKEVWDMQITPAPPAPQRTLEQAKAEMLSRIDGYDSSDDVNGFSINGQEMWLTFDERSRIKTSLDAYESTGMDSMTKWFGEVKYTFPISLWKQMLTALEVYASEALNVTESHKAAVAALETIEDVDSYDYTVGYPVKPTFNIEPSAAVNVTE